MKIQRHWAWLVILVALCMRSQAAVPTPEETMAQDIVRDLGEKHVQRAWVLVYVSMVDARPLYLDEALVVFEENPGWGLVKVFRHPRGDSQDKTWRLAIVNDAPVNPRRTYDHRPTAPDVQQFLQDSWWGGRTYANFHSLKIECYDQTWLEVLGFAPPSGVTPPRKSPAP
jgi:hypothetical protein